MIVGLFSGVLTRGGIERASQHVGAVLAQAAHQQGWPCRFLSLNDPCGLHTVRVNDTTLTVRGCGRSKVQLTLRALAWMLRARVVYLGHPHLAPLSLLRIVRPAIRCLVAAHGVEVWQPLPWLSRVGLRWASTVTAPSRFTAKRLAEAQQYPFEQIVVLPWALDPGLDARRELEFQLPDTASTGRRVLTVARLAASERYKGIDAVLRALPTVLQRIPEVSYVVVGEGDDRPALERLARELGVAPRTRFVGVVADEVLAAHYRACDVFVMPSQQEGFGFSVLEAMAFGKPAIGACDGALPELIVDGVTGFLVKHDDVEALSDRLIRLLSNQPLCERMGQAGRQRMEREYTFDVFRDRLTRLLVR